MPVKNARSSRRRSAHRNRIARGLALLSSLAVALMSLLVVPTAAIAEINSGIKVEITELNNPDGGQLTVGDVATLQGTWDASDAAELNAGDEFTIELPEEFKFEAALPIELKGADENGEEQVWAQCLTDPETNSVTCAVTEVATQWDEVRGEFIFEISAAEATTAEEVVFTVNGEEILVDLPGEGGIDDGIELPTEWTKTGSLNGNKWSMTWTIELPGEGLAGQDLATIEETLSDNHQLCEPSDLRVQTVRGENVQDVTSIGDIVELEDYDFGIELTAPEGGFDPNVTYRITYQTCTIDNTIDEAGTTYTNEAEIWGESSGKIGVEQDWTFQGNIDKWGAIQGGADRNGVIEWTVPVDGAHIAGDTSFILSDEISGAHAVCTDEDGEPYLRNFSMWEHYGPSGDLANRIDGDQVSVSTVFGENGESFETMFAPEGEYSFKGYPYTYMIYYDTCATTEGLPTAGTEFSNEVTINNETVEDTQSVPGRAEGKTGRINTSSIQLGEDYYLPQTALNWNIEIPGQSIENFSGDLTLTDELSGDHMVCSEGEDIGARLGLKVMAYDQINGGGLQRQDLTDSVSTSIDGDTLTFVIPEPELPTVDGGMAEGFSKEYRYVLTYNTCTTSGGMDEPGTTYGNAVTGEGIEYGTQVVQNNSGSGTGTGVARGSVSVSKTLAGGPGSGFVAEGTEFTVHVKEYPPGKSGDEFADEYDLTVPLGGEPVSGFNPRGNGWTFELSEPTFPDVPGVVFGEPKFEDGDDVDVSDDGTVATATISPGSNVEVFLENTALLGQLNVEKVLTGPAADQVDPDSEYTITAEIDVSDLGEGFPQQDDRTFTLEAGESQMLSDLPIGAEVTFTEDAPADDDTFTWDAPVISPETITVEPGHADEAGVVTVTNRVERTVGTFTLAKDVEGAQADNPAVPDDVTVMATWSDLDGQEHSKELTVPTDGTPVDLGEQLVIGTEVTLTEAPLSDGSSIAWGAPVWSGTGVEIDGESAVVTITRDAEAAVVVTNHAATSTAGISILKGVAGEAVDEIPDGTEFPVTATWTDADGVEQSKDLLISDEGPVELGEDLPAGTVVTLTEGEAPGFDRAEWGTIVISGEDVDDAGDGSASVVVSDQEGDATLITVTNEANWKPGTLGVKKSVEGISPDHPDFPGSVTVTATWTDLDGQVQSKDLQVPTDGTEVALGEDLPYQTKVTLTEAPVDGGPSFTWATPVWTGDLDSADDDAGTAVVSIEAGASLGTVVTNTAQTLNGNLAITKELDGDGANGVPSRTAFPVTATWVDLLGETHEVELDITPGGTAVIDGLLLGTEVTLTEGEAAVPAGAEWVSAEWSSGEENVSVDADGRSATVVVTGEDGADASITLTNEFDKVEDLPSTGTNGAGAMIAITLTLIGAGAWLLHSRRRRLS